MKDRKKGSNAKEEPTPITDGDSRPDQLDEDKIAKKIHSKKDRTKDKFTSNRSGDVNSLENFKDEK
jgi:hypothetical protein